MIGQDDNFTDVARANGRLGGGGHGPARLRLAGRQAAAPAELHPPRRVLAACDHLASDSGPASSPIRLRGACAHPAQPLRSESRAHRRGCAGGEGALVARGLTLAHACAVAAAAAGPAGAGAGSHARIAPLSSSLASLPRGWTRTATPSGARTCSRSADPSTRHSTSIAPRACGKLPRAQSMLAAQGATSTASGSPGTSSDTPRVFVIRWTRGCAPQTWQRVPPPAKPSQVAEAPACRR